MSCWTHIVAVLDVDTGIINKNIKSIVEDKLNKDPKITGSEGNAEFFVNVLGDYDINDGYQTRIVITIIGDLRDRIKYTTEEQYKAFYNYIKNVCDFTIRNEAVSITGF